MHELGITQEIVSIVTENARGAQVKRVVLEIGKLTAIMPDAVAFCFEAITSGTVAEGATLDIIETPGCGRCRGCGGELVMNEPFAICDCGGVSFEWLSGKELQVREMELV
ncbi:MAG: hydrogenase maturation nickel metallochaperone HypA [Armatimonadetes bacterium CG2_30_59_28]|nr:hydrogenase maturation nickel metallochaperone HypA [Armatimonadota bacterium]OIO89798.1 MAG: hydrogenase maturation nickel metallochaperone HypA [Armatimonadetes bacterium CG2_30_59_28]PIU63737.1 MAG: hydrogenase maturation nickel metallochaperone HypA [Armatimonadetes bacterium CG07_land_8_20_14_0_80_59_28]PIX40644.1 MAG: hydrogenase maturation nickel metallochaperone HypA [Armatimonadetes bacterium CG_4_8_14_3_um_filter_58_9]PIY39431.1 MAG: hydrogenase maturation nickel metallochaperone H